MPQPDTRISATAHHPGQFSGAFPLTEGSDIRGRDLLVARPDDHEMLTDECRNLRQVGHHYHLTVHGGSLQSSADLRADGIADTGIHLVEDEGVSRGLAREHYLRY